MPENFHILIGNRLETLAGALAELTRRTVSISSPNPLQPETILVQSRGMQRWISISLAQLNGVCANMAFPFPNAFLEEIYTKVIGPLPAHNPFDPQNMTFRIMALIDEMIDQESFEPIRKYLSGRASDLKRYQLSGKIADVFDQYLVFRPELIHSWQRGQGTQISEEHAWQSLLWQRIKADVKNPHRAELQEMLIKRLTDNRIKIANLPARVSIFGISYLPVFHLQVFEALAHRIPVYLFLLNPCRQYWSDILSDHQLIRIRHTSASARIDPTDLHFERGNRLLSSWGQQGRRFFGLIQQMDAQGTELFQDSADTTLLEHIQHDILDLVDRCANPQPAPPDHMPADRSLQVHVCHSPMREVEVLHDQLLAILDNDSQIHPGDILVMTPDIGQYAPFIHAVFGPSGQGRQDVIPYSLADQNITGESRLVEGYLQLLQLKDCRFEVSRVMELLEYEPLRRRFDLDENELHIIETWLKEANINLGWDGVHRRQEGLPRFEDHTWRTGLDRLLAGYAIINETEDLFADVLPHIGIEGSDAQTLGKLIHYAESLYSHIRQIPAKASLVRWAVTLVELLETFFHSDDNSSRDMQTLRSVIARLEEIGADIQRPDEFSFEVVRQFLAENLRQTSSGTGFMAGSVTFCAMLPMRSIPAKVICLLGLQHDAFPMEAREPGFSLIAAEPRPGDRSKRNDDKYIFLEALLSARNIFYISFVGRDIQDNAVKPPSVLVSELLEYIVQGYGIAEHQLVTEHPLQPFSPSYFDGRNPQLFSYSVENRDALQSKASRTANRPFFPEPLPPPDDSWYQCDLGRLSAFFANPTRFLLELRLGIYLRETWHGLEDREKFSLDPLSEYEISQSLMAFTDRGRDAHDHYRTAVAAGELPSGTAGLVVHDGIESEVKRFLNTLQSFLPGDDPDHFDLGIDLLPFHIRGRIDGICTGVRMVYRLAKLRAKDLTSAFIHHLAMNLVPQDRLPQKTLLVCKDAVWEFGPIDPASANEALTTYLTLYWEGLQKPLAFFSLTSFEYAVKRTLKKKDRKDALNDAIKKWRGGYNQAGESQDAYLGLCFGDENPLTPEFESIALKVFDPLFASGRELRMTPT